MSLKAPSRDTPETHQRNAEKLARIPIKAEKPETSTKILELKKLRLNADTGSIMSGGARRFHYLGRVFQ